jgi:hypothetical protein
MHDQFPVVQPHLELHLTREESTLIHAKAWIGAAALQARNGALQPVAPAPVDHRVPVAV